MKHSAGSEAKPNLKIISDMKKMMTYVETAAREANVWENNPSKWSTSKVTVLYERTRYRFEVPARKGRRRFEGIVWKSY